MAFLFPVTYSVRKNRKKTSFVEHIAADFIVCYNELFNQKGAMYSAKAIVSNACRSNANICISAAKLAGLHRGCLRHGANCIHPKGVPAAICCTANVSGFDTAFSAGQDFTACHAVADSVTKTHFSEKTSFHLSRNCKSTLWKYYRFHKVLFLKRCSAFIFSLALPSDTQRPLQ